MSLRSLTHYFIHQALAGRDEPAPPAREQGGWERNMERSYLEELGDAYTRYFLNYHDSPLLMVNAENLKFLENGEHYDLLMEQANAITWGRHYFNPVL